MKAVPFAVKTRSLTPEQEERLEKGSYWSPKKVELGLHGVADPGLTLGAATAVSVFVAGLVTFGQRVTGCEAAQSALPA